VSDDPDLKPCPLCGWSPQLATSFGEPVVGCVNRSCDLCDTEWFDVDAWNTRPIEDALRARAEAAEAALASTRAEADRLRVAIKAAVDALPEWSKGALAHLSPAEVVADEVRMSLREALLPPVESA
jgi:hypothetical protein